MSLISWSKYVFTWRLRAKLYLLYVAAVFRILPWIRYVTANFASFSCFCTVVLVLELIFIYLIKVIVLKETSYLYKCELHFVEKREEHWGLLKTALPQKKIRQISQYRKKEKKIRKTPQFHNKPVYLADSLTQRQRKRQKRAVGPWKQRHDFKLVVEQSNCRLKFVTKWGCFMLLPKRPPETTKNDRKKWRILFYTDYRWPKGKENASQRLGEYRNTAFQDQDIDWNFQNTALSARDRD